jgi:extracellular elastinolytic metalloproteinase
MTRGIRSRARGISLSAVTITALSILALAIPAAGQAVVDIEGVTPQQLPDYDSRASVAPSADQLAAANALGADVSWNRFGVASSVSNGGAFIAKGLQAPDAVSAARNWLEANKVLFRLDSTDSLVAVTSKPFTGTTNDYAIVFRQQADGVASTDGIATVALVGSRDAGWNVAYASSSLAGGSTEATGDVELAPAEAWAQAAQDAGMNVSVVDVAAQTTNADGTTLVVRGMSQVQHVKRAVFATPHEGARAAYDATVTAGTGGNLKSYQLVVDAQTGDLLYRQNQVDNLTDNPTWLAPRHSMPYNPMNAYPWNYPTTDGRSLFCWTATAGCQVVASDNPATNSYPGGVASKVPWDVQLDVAGTNLGTTATVGNNVDDARVWSGSHGIYGNPALVRETSATRDYQPPFTDAWYTSQCNPDNVNATINPLGNDIEASTTSLFVGHNIMHDWAYYLGFDEGHWNAQQYNNGVTTVDPSPPPGGPVLAPLGNDGLIGNAQSGAASGSRDNANMSTGADGQHPTTNQFVWQPLAGSFYAPCVDGAYDFSVFGHEYGHLIENRMIGKGVGARQGTHAGSMGEAFGDFDALAAFNELHLPVPVGSTKYTEGAYATGNPYNGIRDFLAGEPMGGQFPAPSQNPHTDPLNYGNFGFDIVGTEVHADGEIWVAVQIALRELFLTNAKSHGFPAPTDALDISCARGQTAPDQCPGDRRWIQDYYDAMVLMPRGTTMIQARDAMLAADLARYTADPAWGDNHDLLWQGFAMYGFGNTSNTVSNGDANPVPAFDAPASVINNATINFSVDSKEGSAVPVNAQIFVGDYSARSTAIADTNPATVSDGTNATSNLDNVVPILPNGAGSLAGGTTDANQRWEYYNFVAVAPGYGHVRFRVKNLKAGEVRNITIHMPTNYASAAQGATITTDAPATGTNVTPASLIDDNEGTSNIQSCTPTATCLVPVNGRWVVIKLGNTAGIEINRLGVSAMFSSRFVGLRSFDAYSCRAGKVAANPTCDGSIDAGWTKIITGPVDSFPGVNPRPGTQDESLRYFTASPQPVATHVKFVVTNNQCTGQPSFQGDQDLDPANNAECRTGIRRSEVHTAEIEVFAAKPTADGTLVSTG